MHDTSTGHSHRPHGRAALIRLGVLGAILAAAALLAYRLGWFNYEHTVDHIDRIRRSHSLVGFAAVFIGAYGLGTSLGFPGLPFTVAAGVMFGAVVGTVMSWAGAMVGAAAGYWLARTIGHDVVLRWLGRYKRIDAAVKQSRDFAGMFRLRLIPVLPLGTINFVGGLARAPFGRYMMATAIGIIPSLAIYSYFADSLVEGIGSGNRDALVSLAIASALLILVTLAPKLMRSASS